MHGQREAEENRCAWGAGAESPTRPQAMDQTCQPHTNCGLLFLNKRIRSRVGRARCLHVCPSHSPALPERALPSLFK
eukprot:366372-Pleurochrysis_carterae.AAC.1